MRPRRGPNFRNPRSTDLGPEGHVMRNTTSKMSHVNIFMSWQLYTIGSFHLVRHLRSRFHVSGCDYPQVSRPGVSEIATSPKSRDAAPLGRMVLYAISLPNLCKSVSGGMRLTAGAAAWASRRNVPSHICRKTRHWGSQARCTPP